jgi:hypothetical protein
MVLNTRSLCRLIFGTKITWGRRVRTFPFQDRRGIAHTPAIPACHMTCIARRRSRQMFAPLYVAAPSLGLPASLGGNCRAQPHQGTQRNARRTQREGEARSKALCAFCELSSNWKPKTITWSSPVADLSVGVREHVGGHALSHGCVRLSVKNAATL